MLQFLLKLKGEIFLTLYVTMDHKTKHKGQFFKNDLIWKLNK